MNKIDLHIHTTGSDGNHTPEEIIERSKKIGLELLAITDLDSIISSNRASKKSKEAGIKYITGVELTLCYSHPYYKEGKESTDIHVLGYNFDPTDKKLNEVLNKNIEHRLWRGWEIVKKVNNLLEKSKNITRKEFDYKVNSLEGAVGAVGTVHIADILVEKEISLDRKAAFKDYVNPSDVKKSEITFEEGSKLIRNAGGLVTLAHPHGDKSYSFSGITLNMNKQEKIIKSMLPNLDAIECFYPTHNEKITKKYIAITKKLRLEITGGSDHHGGKRDQLGQIYVPNYVANNFKIVL